MFIKKIIRHILPAIVFIVLMLGFEYFMTKELNWIEGSLFSLFIFYVILFCKYYVVVYGLLIEVFFLHGLFFSYFHRSITHIDIKLFFKHISESFESFISLPSLFLYPFVFFILGMIFLWFLKSLQIKPFLWQGKQKYILFSVLFLLNLNAGTMGFEFLYAIFSSSSSSSRQYKEDEIPRYPSREVDYSVVLLIGESMRYDKEVEQRLKKLGVFYKKIYSGATNTDVVVPLLLNTKNNPLFLSKKNETNLFRLAKKSAYQTHFISIQTPKEGRHIKPYLQTNNIDYYRSYTDEEREPLYDRLLIEELNKIDFSSKQFVVMQQIGQHSPYIYFEGEKSESISENYRKSIDKSFELYVEIYNTLLKSKKPFVFMYVSDHGEFMGEGGRYGHNCFEPMVYEVPFFITSNIALPKGYKKITSHKQLSRLIIYLLGYEKSFTLPKEKIIINGTMLSREDGFIEVDS